jgi:hypothetical protein
MDNLVEHDDFFSNVRDNFKPSMEAANSKRKEVEKIILDGIAKITEGDSNIKLYKELFAKMTDKEFDQYMRDLHDKNQTLCVIMPQGDKKDTADINKLLKLSKSLGFDFFERLTYSGNELRSGYTSKNKYMVLRLPIRRAQQLLTKKISTSESNDRINVATGQVIDESKSSKISKPELNILLGLGLKDTSRELMSIRGGDLGGARAFTKFLVEDGIVKQTDVEEFKTGVLSTNTLISYLAGMHIKTNIEE